MDNEICCAMGILYWVAIIIFFIKGKMQWVTFLSLITFSVFPFTMGLIFIYALPKNNIYGEVIPEIPMAISLILVVLSIFSIKGPKVPATAPNKAPSRIRWIFLLSGLASYFIGLMTTLMYFYSPKALGHTTPMPNYGVITSFVFSLISSVFLYLASKEGSINRPNLFRIICTLVILLFFSQTTLIISLLLIYAFPVKPPTSYPTLAGINMVCYLIFALLLIMMRREYVTIDSTKTPLGGSNQ